MDIKKDTRRSILKKIKSTKRYSIPQRVAKDFMDLVMEIQIMYLLKQQKPPSVTKISSIISKCVDMRELRSKFFK